MKHSMMQGRYRLAPSAAALVNLLASPVGCVRLPSRRARSRAGRPVGVEHTRANVAGEDAAVHPQVQRELRRDAVLQPCGHQAPKRRRVSGPGTTGASGDDGACRREQDADERE